MVVPAGPGWVMEHLKRLTANGIQPHFQLANIPQLETVERLIRRGHYMGPLNLTWVAIGGGFDGPNPYNMMNFINRVPDGASLTLETLMRSVLPVNTMAIAMGLHPRCGNEDTLWGRKGEKMTSVQQIEQLVRIAGELGREVATGKEARDIYRSARATPASRRPWPAWATHPTAGPASAASPSTPEFSTHRSADRPRRVRACGPHPAPHAPRPGRDPDRLSPVPSHHIGGTWQCQPKLDGPVGRRRSRPPAVRPSRFFPWVVFVLTFGLLLSDYMSRQVLSAVFPFLKVEWALTDAQLGGLTSIVALTVGSARGAAVAAG